MGKKRGKLGEKNSRSNTNNASLVVARIAKQSVPTHAPQETFGGFHRLDEETIKYFLEVKSHLDTLENPEEQALLVGNALEELSGKEVKVGSDPTCSRILEALIPRIDHEHLLLLLTALSQGEEFCQLSSSPFGSRVAEQLLTRLGELLDSAPDQETFDQLYGVLRDLTGVTVAHLWEFATDRNASHVARRLLCAVAGRDVAPARSNAHSADGAAFIRAAKGQGPPGGLAAKIGTSEASGERQRTPARHSELLSQIVRDLLSEKWSGGRLQELLFHAYGCPWLQALLTAADGHPDLLEELVPRLLRAQPGQVQEGHEVSGEGRNPLEGASADHVQGLAQDPTSSHFLEAVMRVAPEELLAAVYQQCLRGSLARLAMHPSANFVVQAYLAAIHTSQQVKAALRELRDAVPELLRGRRSGVAAALLAAAGRTGNAAVQADATRALASALAALQSADGAGSNSQGLAAALLTHDNPAVALGEASGRARLSTLGCAMLATVLRLPKEASSDFAEALADLAVGQLVHVGGDSGGSRALEAFLDGAASAKLKKKVIRKLAGSFAKLAGTPGGSHVVQTCYRVGGVKDKEAIAQELAAAEHHIKGTKFGQILLSRCAVDDFKRSAGEWRSKAEADAVVRSQFAALLEEANSAPAAATAAADEQADTEEVEVAPGTHVSAKGAAAAAGEPKAEAGAGKKRKKQKASEDGAPAAEQPPGGASSQEDPGRDKKKKKRKHQEQPPQAGMTADAAEPGSAAAAEPDAPLQKKCEKKRAAESEGQSVTQQNRGAQVSAPAEGRSSQALALQALLAGTEAAATAKRRMKLGGSGEAPKKSIGKKTGKCKA